jgi:ribosome-binding protein aMBF1 (putative translation factor)
VCKPEAFYFWLTPIFSLTCGNQRYIFADKESRTMRPDEIKKYRELAGMSEAELALKLGVEKITVQRWERGERKPAAIYLKEIRLILNRKLSEPIPK